MNSLEKHFEYYFNGFIPYNKNLYYQECYSVIMKYECVKKLSYDIRYIISFNSINKLFNTDSKVNLGDRKKLNIILTKEVINKLEKILSIQILANS